jgi:hypothetical protein
MSEHWNDGKLPQDLCEADGLPEPVIKEIQGGIQVTLFKFFAPTKSSTMEVTMEVTTEVTMEVTMEVNNSCP